MTRAEYEARKQRLTEDAESARVALNNARIYYERVCTDLQILRVVYREQLAAESAMLAGEGGAQ